MANRGRYDGPPPRYIKVRPGPDASYMSYWEPADFGAEEWELPGKPSLETAELSETTNTIEVAE